MSPPFHVGIVVKRRDGSLAVLESGPDDTLHVYILEAWRRLHTFKGILQVRCCKKELSPEESAKLTHFAVEQEGKRYAMWRTVVVPQAIPLALPALGNFFIGLFKETPLLAAITVIDIFGAANGIAGRTFRYNEPYTLVAIILLVISLIAAYGLRRLEKKFLRPVR